MKLLKLEGTEEHIFIVFNEGTQISNSKNAYFLNEQSYTIIYGLSTQYCHATG